MWNIKGDLIQIELGNNVIKSFSKGWKRDCGLLINQIAKLRSQLKADGIILPPVSLRDSSTLNPDDYILYMGIISYTGNYRKQSPINLLSHFAQQFHIENYSYENVYNIFKSGVNYLVSQEKDLHKATMDFVKAYYCSYFGDDTYSLMINSSINLCGIQVLNSNLDLALLDAKRATYAAMADGFNDPYIKYSSQLWLGIVYLKKNENEDALKCFISAYNIIEETNSNQLKITSLWTVAYLSVQKGDFKLSTTALATIVDIIKNDNEIYDKDLHISLLELRDYILNTQIEKLQQELNQLNSKYNEISKNFIYKLGNTILSVIHKAGPILISAGIGSLLSGNYHFGTGNIIQGEEIRILRS